MGSVFRNLSLCFIASASLFLNLAAPAQTIAIDATSGGKVFDGVGAISGGGGNARLLIDYPEPYRSQILDYLFKPGYGANIQIFKVEVGADMDSTDGAESSHMHTATDENYNRGYEWWLMEQARARNPNIKLVALAWGAPHWVGNGTYWSPEMITYLVKWLMHAKSDHHLAIEYLGGRNEHGYNVQWYKDLKVALQANGLASVKVIASDDWPKQSLWNIATEMRKDPVLNDAIDIVGVHGPGWGGYPTSDAIALGKPMWDSESHFDEKPPYNEIARNINRNYTAGKVTATVFWPIVSAMYDNLPYDDIGLIKCNQPWSGHYTITPSLWVMAHTTQFTEPGWKYLDSASGFFEQDATGAHGSYVALKSPNSTDFSVIIETVEAKTTETAHFSVVGFGFGFGFGSGFAKTNLHLWTTDLTSADSSQWFAKQADIHVTDGKFSLELLPGHMYSITTTTRPAKGNTLPPAAAPFNLPYADNFERYSVGKMPKYFSDMYGAFETAKCDGGRGGICMSQLTPQEPISWKKTVPRPFTMLGNLDWTNYTVATDVFFEQPGSVDLIGRLTGMGDTDVPDSYVFRLSDTGAWSLIKTATKQADIVLASGTVDAPGVKHWHRLALSFNGSRITTLIDNRPISEISDTGYSKGMVGLGILNYGLVQFDNFAISGQSDASSVILK